MDLNSQGLPAVRPFWVRRWRDDRYSKLYPGTYALSVLNSLAGTGWVTVGLQEVAEGEPEGPYWAWEENQDEHPWVMPQPSRVSFGMCFPYGVETEVARGNGRVVNLRHIDDFEPPEIGDKT